MEKKKKNQEIIDSYDYLSTSASARECTGLIPSLPLSEAERESYKALFHYEPPKPDAEKENEKDV